MSVVKKMEFELVKPGPLTRKESQIFPMLASGMSRKQIADSLYRELSTVSRHVEHIHHKLDASNSTHAVARGLSSGILRMVGHVTEA